MSANPTIGMVTCPLCKEPAAVRKDKRGSFYFISRAGRISPSNDFGQQWFVENATIWGATGTPPDDAPDWIVEGKSFPDNSFSRRRGADDIVDDENESVDRPPSADTDVGVTRSGEGGEADASPPADADGGGFFSFMGDE